MKLEICDGRNIQVLPENPDEKINLEVQEIYEITLYSSETLSDIFYTIDEDPEGYGFFDIEDILCEVESEVDYEEFINENIGQQHSRFLQIFLGKINENLLSEYTDNVVCGEESFWGDIRFDGEENEVQIEKLRTLKNEVIDRHGHIERVLNDETWERKSDLLYIICFSTNYHN